MQPTNNSRPVMDVTAPHRPPVDQTISRPSTPLPVREAPANPGDIPASTPQPISTPQAAPSPEPSTHDETKDSPSSQPLAETKRPVPVPKPIPANDRPPAPAGAIVAAIFVMLVLAGIAVLVYLKS